MKILRDQGNCYKEYNNTNVTMKDFSFKAYLLFDFKVS